MKTQEIISETSEKPKFDLQLLTDEEQLELHIKDELEEIEEFFSKNYDEMELRFQNDNKYDN